MAAINDTDLSGYIMVDPDYVDLMAEREKESPHRPFEQIQTQTKMYIKHELTPVTLFSPEQEKFIVTSRESLEKRYN